MKVRRHTNPKRKRGRSSPLAVASGHDRLPGASVMKTILYLIRHGATDANLARPPLLQGRNYDPPLARLGVRQAEATRDLLAICPIDRCYCTPFLRSVQAAGIVAAPQELGPS